jgi:hypothetical protein
MHIMLDACYLRLHVAGLRQCEVWYVVHLFSAPERCPDTSVSVLYEMITIP